MPIRTIEEYQAEERLKKDARSKERAEARAAKEKKTAAIKAKKDALQAKRDAIKASVVEQFRAYAKAEDKNGAFKLYSQLYPKYKLDVYSLGVDSELLSLGLALHDSNGYVKYL